MPSNKCQALESEDATLRAENVRLRHELASARTPAHDQTRRSVAIEEDAVSQEVGDPLVLNMLSSFVLLPRMRSEWWHLWVSQQSITRRATMHYKRKTWR
eukprot:3002952-Amphidinium_carterae.1